MKRIIDKEKIKASEGETTIPRQLRELMPPAFSRAEDAGDPAAPVTYNYYGVSMNPIFKVGDGLTVLPYGTRIARPGDVIVFRPPRSDRNVVHRIVSVDSKGITTRAYNSVLNDPWILSPENIIGRVISAKRAGRNFRIRGGGTGIVVAGILRVRKWIGSSISKALHPLYHRLSQSGILHGWLSHYFREMKLLYFKRPQGTEIQLVVGKWIIGRYFPQKDSWQIRHPFRLFIDTSVLPKGERIDSQL